MKTAWFYLRCIAGEALIMWGLCWLPKSQFRRDMAAAVLVAIEKASARRKSGLVQ